MAGEVKRLIDELMRVRSKGNPALQPFVRVQLMLAGINPDQHTADSPSEPEVERTLRKMISDFISSSEEAS